jgi:multidrug efflux system membrane fusion protein
VSVYDQTNTAQIDQGKLSVIDNEMNTATGTVNLRAVFPNAKNQLFPNEFVCARLLVDTLANVVRVPVAAVQVGENGNFVWAIGSDGTVSAATVKLGTVDGQFQQVVSGLQAGDRVVTDGTDRLQAGTHVTVEAPPQTPQPAQQPQPPPAQPSPQPAPP